MARLADAGAGGTQSGAALVVRWNTWSPMEHAGDCAAGGAVDTAGSLPLAASPELCGRRRRRGGTTAGTHGVVDRGRLHACQRAAALGADQGGKRGPRLHMTRAGDDAERKRSWDHELSCAATGFSAAPTYSPRYPPPSQPRAFVSTIVKPERLRF